MSSRSLLGVLAAAAVLTTAPAAAQITGTLAPFAPQYTDPATGLTLDQAISRALKQEPSLRAARTGIETARAMRLQAGLRPNPSVSFERREEPAGSDSQSMVAVEWPLDLFRRQGRVAVAEQEAAAIERGVADAERLLAADVRSRYGDVAAAVRDLAILDELVDAARRQHELLRARVDEGATPRLERDLLEVELRRLESDRLLQAGRAEAALVHLKRVLGMPADEKVSVRSTLEELVQREAGVPPPSTPDRAAQRPDVLEAESRLALADARIDRAQREGRFDMSLFAGYMRMDAGFPQRAFGSAGGLERVRGLFHYVSAGAMVTVPILHRNQGEVAAARADRAGAEATLDAARLAAQAEIASARAQDERARQAVALYGGGARTLARQNLAVVEQSYDLGRGTVFDMLSERRRYLDVERAYTDALRAAYQARTALQRALGELP